MVLRALLATKFVSENVLCKPATPVTQSNLLSRNARLPPVV